MSYTSHIPVTCLLQEVNSARIEYLEKMVDPENNMFVTHAAFHPFWYVAVCSVV